MDFHPPFHQENKPSPQKRTGVSVHSQTILEAEAEYFWCIQQRGNSWCIQQRGNTFNAVIMQKRGIKLSISPSIFSKQLGKGDNGIYLFSVILYYSVLTFSVTAYSRSYIRRPSAISTLINKPTKMLL